MMDFFGKYRKFLPLLDIYIKFPLVTVATAVLQESNIMMHRQYIAVFVQIWKWKFYFTLYDTERRITNRQRNNNTHWSNT